MAKMLVEPTVPSQGASPAVRAKYRADRREYEKKLRRYEVKLRAIENKFSHEMRNDDDANVAHGIPDDLTQEGIDALKRIRALNAMTLARPMRYSDPPMPEPGDDAV